MHTSQQLIVLSEEHIKPSGEEEALPENTKISTAESSPWKEMPSASLRGMIHDPGALKGGSTSQGIQGRSDKGAWKRYNLMALTKDVWIGHSPESNN